MQKTKGEFTERLSTTQAKAKNALTWKLANTEKKLTKLQIKINMKLLLITTLETKLEQKTQQIIQVIGNHLGCRYCFTNSRLIIR